MLPRHQQVGLDLDFFHMNNNAAGCSHYFFFSPRASSDNCLAILVLDDSGISSPLAERLPGRRSLVRRAKSRRGRRGPRSGRTTNGVPASATKTREVARSRENGAANKLEVQKNWWASAHFRGLGAGTIGANLARNDTRIGSANNLAIGLVLCWSCFFIVASLN